MALRIEDYALIGDMNTAALVGRNGSIDWLCLPRFNSAACFAALLGSEENGAWSIAPAGPVRTTRRSYRDGTMVLETEYETDDGAVSIVDFMPLTDDEDRIDLMRIVCGRRGRVPMKIAARFRFDYGHVIPWVRNGEHLHAIAGPDGLILTGPIETEGRDFRTEANFTVSEGERLPFTLTWFPSFRPPPQPIDPEDALHRTEVWWRDWAEHCTYEGPWREPVLRSLLTLKALTHARTGGIVAAPTTSLPEALGGMRNWDYRYCWIRDATFTLNALVVSGFRGEAEAWRDWLLRAVAGEPSRLQILYGIAGERRIEEQEVPWLSGYENSRPVRIGNAAHKQLQLDVYGEIMDVLFTARRHSLKSSTEGLRVQRALLGFLEDAWTDPDEGIWEVRGPRRHFTHSKVMAWVAFDRAVKDCKYFGAEGRAEHWRRIRDTIHGDICASGYNADRGAFTQFYGGTTLDAALLMMPLVGFLPPTDPRVVATVEAIRDELMHDGFVHRYTRDPAVDGLPVGEAAFLPCTFWLVDNLVLMGRRDEAIEIFDRLLAVRNDVGLFSEEYDVGRRRLVGNFPQAFSHEALINTAHNLSRGTGGPARPL